MEEQEKRINFTKVEIQRSSKKPITCNMFKSPPPPKKNGQ